MDWLRDFVGIGRADMREAGCDGGVGVVAFAIDAAARPVGLAVEVLELWCSGVGTGRSGCICL